MPSKILAFPELSTGVFIKRYKRFFADVQTKDGEVITTHCPNSGRMTTCIGEGWPAWYSLSDNPKRKLKATLECTEAPSGSMVVANTQWANRLAEWAVILGKIKELKGYTDVQREVKYGKNSRIDLLLSKVGHQCWVEVKSSTLIDGKGKHSFPDAPTERGRKHLLELADRAKAGDRAVMLFLAMREDGSSFTSADDIDPEYGKLLRQVRDEGVEILAYQASVSEAGLSIKKKLRVYL